MSAWRCTACSKLSNARSMPREHWRATGTSLGTIRCGPFEPAVLAPAGSVIAAPVVDSAPDPGLRYRQSRLRQYVACPRSTILASEHTTGGIGASADLGSAFHAVAAEILRTLRNPKYGEPRMATEDAIAVMRETVAAGPWVLGPADYAGTRNADGTMASTGLVGMVCNFANEQWPTARIMAIEERLSHEIVCPDGEIRMLTGTPDLVLSDPPDGAVLVDHKSGLSRPQTPREAIPEGEPIRGAQYLSDGGYFQLVAYGALAMLEWPRIQRVTLREVNWRWMGPPREATMNRAELEHVLPYLGLVMQQLDAGLRGDEEFRQPRPGKQCATRCPVAASCEVPAEQRGVGSLDSPDAADEAAARWVAIRAVDKQLREALKSYVDESDHRPVVREGLVVCWDREGPGRKFGPCAPPVPAAPAATDDAFVSAMEAELQRRTVAA